MNVRKSIAGFDVLIKCLIDVQYRNIFPPYAIIFSRKTELLHSSSKRKEKFRKFHAQRAEAISNLSRILRLYSSDGGSFGVLYSETDEDFLLFLRLKS